MTRFALAPAPGERARVCAAGLPGAVWLPARRIRIKAQFTLGGEAAALVAFGADSWPAATADLIAIVRAGHDGPRIAGLELLEWHRADGLHLSTRPSLVPGGDRLALARAAARPLSGGRAWRRESWTDYLRAVAGQPTTDDPARAPLAGTWQAALSSRRQSIEAELAPGRTSLTEPLLALAADGAP